MQFERDMAFARTEIICHGARAQRIGERIFHNTCKYLKSTDFVKGNISDKEREKMIDSISLVGLINMPKDLEKIDTGCDIIFQILLGDDEQGLQTAKKIKEESSIPNITFIIGETENELDIPYIVVGEKEDICETFLDLFSIYTFPQEYGADFEELRPFFDYNGKLSTEKGKSFNLCVVRKASKEVRDTRELFELEKSEGTAVIASRIVKEGKIQYYSI